MSNTAIHYLPFPAYTEADYERLCGLRRSDAVVDGGGRPGRVVWLSRVYPGCAVVAFADGRRETAAAWQWRIVVQADGLRRSSCKA